MPRKSAPSSPIKEYAQIAFGATLGSIAAMMIFIAIGAAFFIPGFILVNRENRKTDPATVNQGLKVLGYILMCIGMIVGVGFGASAFFGTVLFDIAN